MLDHVATLLLQVCLAAAGLAVTFYALREWSLRARERRLQSRVQMILEER